MAAIGTMEARYYDQESGSIKFTSRRKDGVPRKAYMGLKGSVEIQKEEAKVLKVTTIVPYRPERWSPKESIHGLKGLCRNPKGSGKTPKGDYNRALQADKWSNHRGNQ